MHPYSCVSVDVGLTIASTTDIKDQNTLQRRVDSYGVSLQDLIGKDEDSQHKFTIEMKGRDVTVDFVFREIVKNVMVNAKSPKSTG